MLPEPPGRPGLWLEKSANFARSYLRFPVELDRDLECFMHLQSLYFHVVSLVLVKFGPSGQEKNSIWLVFRLIVVCTAGSGARRGGVPCGVGRVAPLPTAPWWVKKRLLIPRRWPFTELRAQRSVEPLRSVSCEWDTPRQR